jgi:hypothetical protein
MIQTLVILMFKMHNILNILGPCLALALFMAGFSDAHAASIVIDTFDDGPEQQAPPDSRLDVPSVLGGSRFLQSTGEATVIVAGGVLQAINAEGLGGDVQAIWDGGEGQSLGGVDLTDGGSNALFDVVVGIAPIVAPTETLGVIVEDSSGTVGRFDIGWTELVLGSNLIPFSSLSDGVDLTSVNVVRLENVIVVADTAIAIDSFSAIPIPEPSTALLFASLLGLIGIARRKRAA